MPLNLTAVLFLKSRASSSVKEDENYHLGSTVASKIFVSAKEFLWQFLFVSLVLTYCQFGTLMVYIIVT